MKPNKTLQNVGYRQVTLSTATGVKYRKVHILVALAFIPNPNNYPVVMHLDDDTENNCTQNLKWGTQQDNIRDRDNKGRQARGGKNSHAKLTAEQVLEIRASTEMNKVLAEKYGVGASTISSIITRRIWKHI